MNLIVPMAGKSTRFPNLRPKWMLTHPSGRFMAIEAIHGLNLNDFDNIWFVCLQEHEEQFKFCKGFEEDLLDAGLLEKTTILMLDHPTVDQPETVLQAIRKGGIKGSVFIKDSDNFFHTKVLPGNSVCFYDLNESGLVKPANKSYLAYNPQGYITNIVEKKVISPYFCVGGYGFESADLFCDTLEQLVLENDRYISHIIFQLILQDVPFNGNKVYAYQDWGTLEDWNRYKRSFATLFVDIDGTLVKNSSMHFPPYIGNTAPLNDNIKILRHLHESGKFQVVLTTSRPEKYRTATISQLYQENIPYDHLIMGMLHAKRIIINDYGKSNPYKSCDAINLARDSNLLSDMLRDALGVDFEEI